MGAREQGHPSADRVSLAATEYRSEKGRRFRMDTSFASAVDQWHDFYVMTGTVSATLVGLLFVSVSLHAELMPDPAATGALASARHTFGNFILILLIALVFVIPAQSPHGLGIPLVIFSASALIQTARAARILLRERAQRVVLAASTSDQVRLGIGMVSGLGCWWSRSSS